MGDSPDAELMARLAQHRSIGKAPAAEHAWLVNNGSLRAYPMGSLMNTKGHQATHLQIVLSGQFVIRMDRGAGSHKVFEWKTGDVGGVMPYSRGAAPPADVVTEEAGETLTVSKELFHEMVRACPVVTATLVQAMIDRARQFTTNDLHDEKLIALGKLAAGLAHELNNPASAVVRSAKTLPAALGTMDSSARVLAAAGLSSSQLEAIDRVRDATSRSEVRPVSSLDRADQEEAILDWLSHHGVDPESAGPLANAGVAIEELNRLATQLSGPALDASLQWLAAGWVVRSLSSEIEIAATRISDLVGAVKGFSYMDQAPKREAVDLRRGLSEALTMLGAKSRNKSVTVSLDIAPDLPCANAVGAELNQVWLNLLDNALDAVPNGGRIEISGRGEHECVVIRIADNGPGIPPEAQSRIFDPFFTTKGVGKGTGLGLDIVRRLLQRVDGDIGVDSKPGRTVFQVRLPVANSKATSS